MIHVTVRLSRAAVLSVLVLLCAGPAWAQFDQTDGADLFADRNGTGTDCTMMSNPCNLAAAVAAVLAADDTVWVRVREAESTTRVEDDISTESANFTVATYARGTGPTKGTVVLEGDAAITSTVTVADGTTLQLESDEVTIGASGEVDGELVLGGGGTLTLNLPGGEDCVDALGAIALVPGQTATFNLLTIAGDVKVESAGCASGDTPEVTVDHLLVVKRGAELDMGDVRLKMAPVVEMDGDEQIRGSMTVEAGASIMGNEHFVLMPEAESVVPAGVADTVRIVDTEDFPLTRACLTAGAYFPSDCTGEEVDLPATALSTDIGQIVRRIEAQTGPPAVPGSITILPFKLADGYANTPEGCFKVSGGGAINMDIQKLGDITDTDNNLSQGGACIDVPVVGNGGMSTNNIGSLFFTGTTSLDGSFRNAGRARTEFWKLGELTEDLEILGEDPDNSFNASGFGRQRYAGGCKPCAGAPV